MARFIHRTTYEYVTSGHSPDYPTGTWLKNPNLSGVSGVPQKYWKVVGDTVVEMTQAEKDAVDAAIAAGDQLASESQEAADYQKPEDVLFYYGYPNSFNSATHGWNNEKVAQEMAQYGIIIFGDGVQDSSHPDYANTQVIVPRVKELNPRAKLFGYVTANQTQTQFENKADDWSTLSVRGIFIDEAGYDFGNDRDSFNDKVDYVHSLGAANLCFANAWNTDHILGTANDVSYPNSTWNPSEKESKLNQDDYILLESFAVNTAAYSGSDGYAPKADWLARGQKIVGLRADYGVKFVSVGIIANGDPDGQDLFDFHFTASVMWSLEGQGTSDTNYGASTAQVTKWTRPDMTGLGTIGIVNPDVLVDADTVDPNAPNRYWRYIQFGRMKVDFTTSAQTSTIEKY